MTVAGIFLCQEAAKDLESVTSVTDELQPSSTSVRQINQQPTNKQLDLDDCNRYRFVQFLYS